jgi:hypothetical protein
VINDTFVPAAFNKQCTYGFKIKTNIPFINNSAMPTFSIDGYDYTSGSPIDLQKKFEELEYQTRK